MQRAVRLIGAGVLVAALFGSGYAVGRVEEDAPPAAATSIWADWCAYRAEAKYDRDGNRYMSIVGIAGNFGPYNYISDYDARQAIAAFDCDQVY